jgi:hypothetical protein
VILADDLGRVHRAPAECGADGGRGQDARENTHEVCRHCRWLCRGCSARRGCVWQSVAGEWWEGGYIRRRDYLLWHHYGSRLGIHGISTWHDTFLCLRAWALSLLLGMLRACRVLLQRRHPRRRLCRLELPRVLPLRRRTRNPMSRPAHLCQATTAANTVRKCTSAHRRGS